MKRIQVQLIMTEKSVFLLIKKIDLKRFMLLVANTDWVYPLLPLCIRTEYVSFSMKNTLGLANDIFCLMILKDLRTMDIEVELK